MSGKEDLQQQMMQNAELFSGIEKQLNISMQQSDSCYAADRRMIRNGEILVWCKVWSMIRFISLSTDEEDFLTLETTHVLTIQPGREQNRIISDRLIKREFSGAYAEELKAYFIDDTVTVEELLMEKPSAAPEETAVVPESQTQAVRKERDFIFIGDSRFNYMMQVVAKPAGHHRITLGGAAYSWFETEALPQLFAILQMCPDAVVIVNMGLNDCALNIEYGMDDSSGYIQRFTQIQSLFPDAVLCFASVGPVDGTYGGIIDPSVLNQKVRQFNSTLKEHCPDIDYIPLGEYLELGGFQTTDGIHYDFETSQRIYTYCWQFMEMQITK